MTQQVLVTGATGYIGGRLVPELLEKGHSVRCLARNPDKLSDLAWSREIAIAKGDVGDLRSMVDALSGIDAAYFLVHSMDVDSRGAFAERDRGIAQTFRTAAEKAGVKRIIYLGGLGDGNDPNLSQHLASRHEVGQILASGPVPTIELRAAIIIGSGSASFEMLRNLVEVLPVMVAPKWLNTRVQPIAIRDVLAYLCGALDIPAENTVLEIGGPDVLTYRQVMDRYAQCAGLKPRKIITLPLLTPGLSSHWIGLVTPLPTSLAKPLVHGLMNEVIVNNQHVDELMARQCLDFAGAVKLAIQRTRDLEVTTSWADAEISGRSSADPMPSDPSWSGGTVLDDTQTVTTAATPHAVYQVITGIGGKRGWFVTDKLWLIRGWLDKAFGGVGMRRGRRHPDNLHIGDALDFWRVEALVPDKLLRLRAEMRLPGTAWLEWTIEVVEEETRLTQRARYYPRGLAGRLYWYSLLPFHAVIFRGLAKAIVTRAKALG